MIEKLQDMMQENVPAASKYTAKYSRNRALSDFSTVVRSSIGLHDVTVQI